MAVERLAARLRDTFRPLGKVAIVAAAAGALIVVQDVVLAHRFATGAAMDAYQLAISFPSLALNIFAGGTLLATLVPKLVQLEAGGHAAEAAGLVRRARAAMSWLLLAVCAAWAAAYPAAVTAAGSELSASTRALSTRLTWTYLPVLWLSGMASVEAALLNSRRRFGLQSAIPAFLPAGVIAGVLLGGSRLGITAAALGAVCGSGALWLWARASTGALLSGTTAPTDREPSLRTLLGPYGASAAAAALLGGVLMSDTWIASTLPAGSTATFGYATRPIVLLLAFATTVVGNVLLPTFSRLAATGDRARLRRHFLAWSALLATAAAPVVLAVYLWAPDLVALAYQRGTFGPADTANVSAVLRPYVLQAPFFLIGMVGWRLLNSLQLYGAMLVAAAVAFAANLAVDLWLTPSLGLAGVAWGTNAAFAIWAVVNVVFLAALAPRGSTKCL